MLEIERFPLSEDCPCLNNYGHVTTVSGRVVGKLFLCCFNKTKEYYLRHFHQWRNIISNLTPLVFLKITVKA